MKFPEDFARFEKLSPHFGEVRDVPRFWSSLVSTLLTNQAHNSQSDPAEWMEAKSIAWAGYAYSLQKGGVNIPCKNLPDITPTLNITPDYILLLYLTVPYLPWNPEEKESVGALLKLMEVRRQPKEILSFYMGLFDQVDDSPLFNDHCKLTINGFVACDRSSVLPGDFSIHIQVPTDELEASY